jgi:ribosomal-protein-alanine N-acetyltransferase
MGIEDGEDRQADRRLANELAAIHAVAFAGLGRPWSAPEILALLTDPRVVVHVARAERQMPGGGRHAVGYALCRVVADEAELLTLAVMPEARREGLGVGLLTACEKGARASGASRLFLEVAAANAAAGALYARAGYCECGRREDYYLLPGGSRDDAVVMAKRL